MTRQRKGVVGREFVDPDSLHPIATTTPWIGFVKVRTYWRRYSEIIVPIEMTATGRANCVACGQRLERGEKEIAVHYGIGKWQRDHYHAEPCVSMEKNNA